MDIEFMRSYVLSMYPGPKWAEKVACMPDRQIIAVYYSMKKKGQKPISDKPNKRQLTIYDYDEDGCFIVRK